MSTDHPFHNNVESKHEKGPKGQRFPCSMSSNRKQWLIHITDKA